MFKLGQGVRVLDSLGWVWIGGREAERRTAVAEGGGGRVDGCVGGRDTVAVLVGGLALTVMIVPNN
jgi:hypothetical protein